MADEMDDSWGSEEQDPIPKDKATEHVEGAADIGSGDVGSSAAGADISAAGEKSGVGGHEPQVVEHAPKIASAKGGLDEQPVSPEFEEASPRSGEIRTQSQQPVSARPADAASGQVAFDALDKPGLDLLYDVELDATLQFGSKEMLLRDVLELGPGDVVELDRHIAEPVDLVVGDRIVARGEVVIASGNFALRITEVATPQMRLESIRCLF